MAEETPLLESVAQVSMGMFGRVSELFWPASIAVLQMCLVGSLCFFLYKQRRLFTVQRAKHQSEMWGFVSIPKGERWNMWTANGDLLSVDGPKVVCVFGATLCKLVHYSATSSQYLQVLNGNGTSKILHGPTSMYKDCTIHKEIHVMPAVSLTDHEVLVTYRKEEGVKDEKNEQVIRSLVHGPCLHVPVNSSEWTHEFLWHGSTDNTSSDAPAKKYKNALRFKKLRTCPDQTYYDVESVRTRDDALVSVKLMIFYRLKDIEIMLRETHDPIADFINAVSSDIIDFVAGKTFEEFKGATDQLNELKIYQQLRSRASSIGFEVTKVVFRGYGAPQRLQKMHDDAIERRTKLALERETEQQEQSLLDMKLEREEQRLHKQWEIEKATEEHKRALQREQHQAEQLQQKEERGAELEHFMNLKQNMGLSPDHLASYMLAWQQGAPEKLIQIVSKESSGNGFVHLTQSVE
mmetsp:Transcript_8658/g.16185  ORF Transcript_8658/g.16185 Transcript_8658/m.16185 type:complete len:464 (-) Transcript_8658:119-1510(-)